ncbi:MAG: DUF4292 domain-containing protein [Flavobacteriales bacterium]|nr:DUF4292 domain-containing protein [Flavobacteriales bacterium]
MRSTFLFLVSIFVLWGCHTKKNIALTNSERKISVDSLLTSVNSTGDNLQWLSAKYAIKVENKDGTKSFKSVVRLRKDSVIWVSITPLMGIEVARLLIRQDSVFMINRLNSTYFKGNFDFLSEKFKTQLDFNTIQDLLLAQPLYSYSASEKLWHKYDKNLDEFTLSTVKQSHMYKDLDDDKKEKLMGKYGHLWHTMSVSGESLLIQSQEVYDAATLNKLRIRYSNYKDRDGQQYPDDINVEVSGIDTINTKINVSSVSLNKKKKISFRIPEKYEEVTF